jgi:hypothetical protein
MTSHDQDSDCVTDADGTCTICGVHHGCPCETCGGAGFHKDDCEETKALYAEEQALAAKFPVGARVRIIDSDLFAYIGLTGTVADYGIHSFPDELPLVGVQFDAPVVYPEPPYRDLVTRDGFYGDELTLLSAPACDGCGGPLGPDARDGECGCRLDSDGCVWTEDEDEDEDEDIAHLRDAKRKANDAFMAAISASSAAQVHILRARDAYLAAAERLYAAERRST